MYDVLCVHVACENTCQPIPLPPALLGCGSSTPFAELRENTTWDSVRDFEKIRVELGLQQWQVFGGSWGRCVLTCVCACVRACEGGVSLINMVCLCLVSIMYH